MGKSGEMLRWMKEQKKSYTFTRAQIEEHDRVVRMNAIQAKKDELKKYALQEAEKAYQERSDRLVEDFKQREELLTGDTEQVTINIFSLLIAVSCRVLVKDFGWKPAPMRKNAEDGGDTRFRLTRFAYCIQREVEDLLNDEKKDIRRYAEMVFEETGIKFSPEADGE